MSAVYMWETSSADDKPSHYAGFVKLLENEYSRAGRLCQSYSESEYDWSN